MQTYKLDFLRFFFSDQVKLHMVVTYVDKIIPSRHWQVVDDAVVVSCHFFFIFHYFFLCLIVNVIVVVVVLVLLCFFSSSSTKCLSPCFSPTNCHALL